MHFSYSTKEKTKDFIKIVFLLGVGYLYWRYPFYKPFPNYWWLVWLWLGGILILVNIFGILTVRLGNRIRGEDAEEDVDFILNDLPQNFFVLGSMILGDRGNIDNVVVGRTGVWTIEVKSHSGKITFDDKELVRDGELLEKDFIKQAWAEAYIARDFLKERLGREFLVQPVIVFSNPKAELHFGLNKIKGVYVIKTAWLKQLITKNKLENWDNKTVEMIVSALKSKRE